MTDDDQSFEWDEAKRQATLAKHGIDFPDAVQVFAEPHILRPARSEVEPRWKIVGPVSGNLIAVFFTRRGEKIRIITARRARDNERQDFRTLHAGGTSADGGEN